MIRSLFAVDRRLTIFTLLLMGLGLFSVFGASTYDATVNGDPELSLVLRHLVRGGLALAACAVMSLVPYRLACRLALIGLVPVVGMLALTVIGGKLVRSAHDIGRWIEIFGVVVQPVELAKLALALAIPYWLDSHPESRVQFRGGFLTLLMIPAPVLLLLALQPNFGSALALGAMCGLLFFFGGVRLRYLTTLGGVVAGLCWLGYSHVGKLKYRVDAWLELLLGGGSEGTAVAYQSWQALVGIGSGGLTGVGPGASTMKYRFLPEGHTDFIFAIFSEELGFVGAAFLLVVLGLWLARAMKIAWRAPDGLAYLAALGIGTMVFTYATINLCMVVGLLPVAGLPLPFMSYGGSALITNMAGVGVLLNISRRQRRGRRPNDRWKGFGP